MNPTPGYDEPPERVAFFTDSTVCIGCKACEVACKEWNQIPERPFDWTGESYDNTSALGSEAWRHVAFIEQPFVDQAAARQRGDIVAERGGSELRWLMSSDVCKHCTTAACLDVCPTGALFKTELATVVVQPEICNGCGYCVPACPYGVIDRREGDGRAWKCTMCYDRLKEGREPACSTACPTESILFGTLAEMTERAHRRVDELHRAGVADARLYGEPEGDGAGVDGTGALFLLLDEPEVYGLPPDPVATTKGLGRLWGAAAAAAGVLAATVLGACGGRR